MKKLIANGFLLAALLGAGVHGARAASPVTVNNAANSSSACVINGYLCVTSAGGGSVTTTPVVVTTTDRGGTITAGTTAQTAIAANTSRKGWCIQNDPAATESLWVRANGAASATTGAELVAGAQACNQAGTIDQTAISVYAVTTGHRWFGSETQ